jgi:membrane-associated phospholipid phosphatase
VGLAAIATATRFDASIARAVHDAGCDTLIARRGTWQHALSFVAKIPGEWYGPAAAALAVTLSNLKRWNRGAFVFLAALASSINGLIKWIPGRQRPRRDGVFYGDSADLHWFRDGLTGLFHQSNLSFPSGHAAMSFAVATALALLYPRWGRLALIWATITGCERILSNSHYLSDVLAGALLGSAATYALWCILAHLRIPSPLPPSTTRPSPPASPV